jgi:hypothetical protein
MEVNLHLAILYGEQGDFTLLYIICDKSSIDHNSLM